MRVRTTIFLFKEIRAITRNVQIRQSVKAIVELIAREGSKVRQFQALLHDWSEPSQKRQRTREAEVQETSVTMEFFFDGEGGKWGEGKDLAWFERKIPPPPLGYDADFLKYLFAL